jgi:GT2 family glycosyltransferase
VSGNPLRTNNEHHLSVVVCCYTPDRFDLLAKCVRSVDSQIAPVHETIVVVDHNDELLDRATRAFANARVIPNTQARGLSGARDTGTATAVGTVIAFLDDDAYAEPQWSKLIVAAFDDPRVFAVGGAVIPDFESGRPQWFPPELDWIIGCTHSGHSTVAGPIRNVVGANMAFRAATLRAVGGFLPELGRNTAGQNNACDETELCIRAANSSGGIVWYQPDAAVHHFVPRSRTTAAYLRHRCYQEGRSKAIVAAVAGTGAGLSSERAYLRRTLPRAAAVNLGRGITRFDRAALGRSAAIAVAPIITAAGYASALRLARRSAACVEGRVSPTRH